MRDKFHNSLCRKKRNKKTNRQAGQLYVCPTCSLTNLTNDIWFGLKAHFTAKTQVSGVTPAGHSRPVQVKGQGSVLEQTNQEGLVAIIASEYTDLIGRSDS